MNACNTIVSHWGAHHFQQSPRDCLALQGLLPNDAAFLADIGLPVKPRPSLRLHMQDSKADIFHSPDLVHRLTEAELEIGPHYPRTGHLNSPIDLRTFYVLGRVRNFRPKQSWYLREYLICIDSERGHLWWVSKKLREQKTDCCFLNAGLPEYLHCLFSQKLYRGDVSRCPVHRPPRGEIIRVDAEFKDEWETVHARFVARLKLAEPDRLARTVWGWYALGEANYRLWWIQPASRLLET